MSPKNRDWIILAIAVMAFIIASCVVAKVSIRLEFPSAEQN